MKKFRNLWVLAKFVLGAAMAGWGFNQLFGHNWTMLVCGLILAVSAAHQAIQIDRDTPND